MTVKMTRTEPMHHGGPTSADVHPDEVENWKAHGWSVAEPAKPKPDSKAQEGGEAQADPLAQATQTAEKPAKAPRAKKPGRKPKSA